MTKKDKLKAVLNKPRTPPAWRLVYQSLEEIEACMLDGGRLSEIADALDISRSAISQALRKARVYRDTYGAYVEHTTKPKPMNTQTKDDVSPPAGVSVATKKVPEWASR